MMRLEADSEIRSTLQDLIGLVVIAALLVAIHFFVPPTLKEAFVFDYTQFRGYTLFTAAFVHSSDSHLYGNLLGFAMTALYAYMLSLSSNGLRWFRRTTTVLILVLPIFVNLSSFVIFSWLYPTAEPISRGFSGVVAGLGGMLLVALYRFFEAKFDGDLAWTVTISVFLLLMQLIDFRYQGGANSTVTGLVLLGIGLVVGSYVYQHDVNVDGREGVERIVFGAAVVVLVGAVLAVLILGLFPQASALAEEGAFTNIFAHAAGFLWGTVIATTLTLIH